MNFNFMQPNDLEDLPLDMPEQQSSVQSNDLEDLPLDFSSSVKKLQTDFQTKFGRPFRITTPPGASGKKGVHKRLYNGQAADIGGNDLSDDEVTWLTTQAPQFGIDAKDYRKNWRDIGGSGPHIHMNAVDLSQPTVPNDLEDLPLDATQDIIPIPSQADGSKSIYEPTPGLISAMALGKTMLTPAEIDAVKQTAHQENVDENQALAWADQNKRASGRRIKSQINPTVGVEGAAPSRASIMPQYSPQQVGAELLTPQSVEKDPRYQIIQSHQTSGLMNRNPKERELLSVHVEDVLQSGKSTAEMATEIRRRAEAEMAARAGLEPSDAERFEQLTGHKLIRSFSATGRPNEKPYLDDEIVRIARERGGIFDSEVPVSMLQQINRIGRSPVAPPSAAESGDLREAERERTTNAVIESIPGLGDIYKGLQGKAAGFVATGAAQGLSTLARTGGNIQSLVTGQSPAGKSNDVADSLSQLAVSTKELHGIGDTPAEKLILGLISSSISTPPTLMAGGMAGKGLSVVITGNLGKLGLSEFWATAIPEMLGFGSVGYVEHAHEGAGKASVAAVENAILIPIYKSAGLISNRPVRIAASGLVGGASTAALGGDLSDVLQSTIIGAALAWPGGSKSLFALDPEKPPIYTKPVFGEIVSHLEAQGIPREQAETLIRQAWRDAVAKSEEAGINPRTVKERLHDLSNQFSEYARRQGEQSPTGKKDIKADENVEIEGAVINFVRDARARGSQITNQEVAEFFGISLDRIDSLLGKSTASAPAVNRGRQLPPAPPAEGPTSPVGPFAAGPSGITQLHPASAPTYPIDVVGKGSDIASDYTSRMRSRMSGIPEPIETGLEDFVGKIPPSAPTLPSIVYRSDNGSPLEVLSQEGEAFRVRNANGRTYLIHQNATFIPEGVSSEGKGSTVLHGQTGEPLTVLGSNRSGYIVKNEQNKIYTIHRNATSPLPVSFERTAIPETPITLNAQMQALSDGRKSAVLITPGESMPEIPQGMIATHTPVGTFIHPVSISQESVLDVALMNNYHGLLGLVSPRPLEGEPAVTIVAQDKDGNELQTAVVPPEDARLQRFEFKKIYPHAIISIGDENLNKAVLSHRADEIERQGQIVSETPARVTGVEGVVARQKQEQRKLRRELDTDALTGVQSARAFHEAKEHIDRDPNREWVSIDLNNFKSVNDTLGHTAGDERLKSVGQAMLALKESNPSIQAFRSGGDEFSFAVLKGQGEFIARQIEDAIKSEALSNNKVYSVSATTDDTYDQADAKLQAAKAERKSSLEKQAPSSLRDIVVSPGSVIHGSTTDALSGIMRSGIQPSELSGAVDVEVVGPTGKALSAAAHATGRAGRSGEPVLLILKKDIANSTSIGPTTAQSDGKSYVSPRDIEAVQFADGTKLSLSDAVERIEAQKALEEFIPKEEILSKEKTPQEVGLQIRTDLREKYGRDLPITDLMQDISSIHDEMQKSNLDAHAQLEAYRTIGFDFKDPVQMTGTVRAVQSEFGQIPLVNVLYKTGGQNLNYRVLGRFPGGEKVLVMSPDSKIKIIQSPFGQTGNTRVKGGATREHFGKVPTVKWQEIGMLSDAWPTKAEIHRINPGIDNVLDLTDSELQEHFPEVWKRLQEAQNDFGNASGKEMMKIASKEGDGSDPLDVQSRRDAIRDLFNTPNIQLENSAEMLYNAAVVTGYDLLKLHPEKKVWEARMIEKLGDNAKPYLSNAWDAINNKAPMFFSPLERVIKTGLPAKASADQIKGIIRKSGVTDDEMKWTGFDDFLKEKAMKEQSVTRQEALEFFQKNKVQLTERVFAEKPLNTDIPRDMIDKLNESNLDVEATSDGKLIFIDRLDKEEYTVADLDEMSEVRPRDAESARVVNDYWISRNLNLPKFTSLTTPGGTNDREITLSLPLKNDQIHDKFEDLSPLTREAVLKNPDRLFTGYTVPDFHKYGIHQADKNRIALLRVNDRVGSNGEKILHVDEYQDDLQNEIQKQKQYIKEIEADLNKPSIFQGVSDRDVYLNNERDLKQEKEKLEHLQNLLPFRGKSHELAMKYALGYAINHGYDMITWSTGSIVADRYDLSKHMNSLRWQHRVSGDGGYFIYGYKGNQEILRQDVQKDKLADFVGKDIAEKIITSTATTGEFTGIDLRVGGEGKLHLYDKMIPDFMRKYTKRWDGSVDATHLVNEIDKLPEFHVMHDGVIDSIQSTREAAESYINRRPEVGRSHYTIEEIQPAPTGIEVHALLITPQMRDSILRSGQSLFNSSEGQPSAVIDALMRVKEQQARRRRNPSITELESKAYHGSPYHFDKFTLEHIGKGEGAQAYGWGLYFTDTKKIAEFYRDKLTDDRQPSVREQAEAIYNALEPLSDGTVFAGQWQTAYNKDEFIRAYEENKLPYDSFSRGVLDKAEKLLFPKGKLYEVNLAPADDEYLLWDKPLNEQSEKVQKILADDQSFQSFIKEPTNQEVEGWGEIALQKGSGRDLYNAIANRMSREMEFSSGDTHWSAHVSNDEAASKYLSSLGIRGIKYLDAMSRSKGEGSYNYVIFDGADAVINEIENKNLSKENIEQAIYDHSLEASEMIATSRIHLGDQMTTGAVSRASRAGRAVHVLGKAGDAFIDYRDKSNRLYLNNVSEEILRVLRTAATGKRADTVYGVALDASKLNELITEANSMQELDIDPRAKNVIADLSKAFQSSLDKNQPLVIADASVTNARLNVKHEEVHRVDFMIRDAFDGVVPDANEIIQIPHMDKLFSKIKSKGYKPDPRIVAMESIARISTGDNEGLDLTEDEELEFLDGYYTLMADTYHEDVLDQYRLITNKAREVRDAVQARFREFSEGSGDAAEAVQSMEVGRERGIATGAEESTRRAIDNSYGYLDRKITEGSLGRSPIEDTYHISVVTGYETLRDDPTVDKATWQSSMLKELGERVRPHLDAVWDLISGKAPTFYSPVENLIRTKVPNKASIEQIKGILKGVSDDELKWSGLNTILSKEKGAITKQELLDYLAVNNLKVETITSGTSLPHLEWTSNDNRDENLQHNHYITTDTVGYHYEIKSQELKNLKTLVYELVIRNPAGGIELERDVDSIEAGQGFAEGYRFDKKKPEEIVANEIEQLKEAGWMVSQNPDVPSEIGFEAIYGTPTEEEYGEDIYTVDELPRGLRRAASAVVDIYSNHPENTSTRYSQYKLEGGSSYVELKIVVPSTEHKAMLVPGTTREGKEIWQWQQMDEKALSPDYSSREDAIENRPTGYTYIDDAHNPILDIQPSVQVGKFQSGHWDEENVLAHIRGDEREHTDGVTGFVIDETQSDWISEGRKKGYKSDVKSPDTSKWSVITTKDNKEFYGQRDIKILDEVGKWVAERSGFSGTDAEAIKQAAQDRLDWNLRDRVPDTPFIKQWPLLTVKQSLRHAVERGLNRISLMPARVHIDRWGTERAVWSKAYGVISDDKIGSFITHGRNTVSSFATETEAKDAIAKIGAENNVNYKIERVWKFQFKGQEGGVAGGINLEQEGLARGILSKGESVIVRNKEDIKNIVFRSAVQDKEQVLEKIWKEMQRQEDEGITWYRAEGLLNRYGDTAEYIQQRFPGRPDLLKFAWNRADGKQSEAFMPIAMRDVGKAWRTNAKIDRILSVANQDWSDIHQRIQNLGESYDRYSVPVYSLDITPQMSSAVIRTGQPLYGTSVDDPSYVLDAKMRMNPQGRKNVVDMGIVVGHQILSKENISEFKSWSDEMTRQLGESIRPHLESIWSRLQEAIPTELQSIRFNKPDATGKSDPFYSPLEEAIDEGMKGRMEAAQLKGYLRAQGITDDEMKWTGFDDYLKERAMKEEKITKQEALEFLKNNRVKLIETEFGNPKEKERIKERKQQLLYKLRKFDITEDLDADNLIPFLVYNDEAIDPESDLPEGSETLVKQYYNLLQEAYTDEGKFRLPLATKFGRSELVLPGGTSYKEMTLSLGSTVKPDTRQFKLQNGYQVLRIKDLPSSSPGRYETETSNEEYANNIGAGVDDWVIVDSDGEQLDLTMPSSMSKQEAINSFYIDAEEIGADDIASAFIEIKSGERGSYKVPESHAYGIDVADINRLAHVRFDDRTDAEGKKVLFLEEIQSDWLQNLRKHGKRLTELPEGHKIKFDPTYNEGRGSYIALDENNLPVSTPTWNGRGSTEELTRKHAIEALNNHRGGIPDAPFSKTWPDLVLRRMIRYAAENGYDKISWTTGSQQADRYDLSKYIQELRYKQRSNGNYYLDALDTDGRHVGERVGFPGEISPDKLEDYVGKEIAQKIIDGQGEHHRDMIRLSGVDLKVGGEGMKGFYDKILPSVANKIGKKWGAKVSQTSLTGELSAARNADGTWSILIDGKMKRPSKVWTTKEEAEAAYSFRQDEFLGPIVHSLDITPSMKESVLREGQPMFGSEPPVLKKIRDLLTKEKPVTELESKRPRGVFIPDPILISKAIDRFGTASDIKEAGFISSYGEIIGDKDHPYINVEISEMMDSDVEHGEDDDTRNNMLTWEFMHQTGSIAVTHLGKDHFIIRAVRPVSKTQSDLLIEKLGGSRRLIITSYNPLNESIEFNQKLDQAQPEAIKQSIKELNDHILQNPTDLESKKKDQEWSVGYRSEGGKLTGSEGNGIYISKKKSLAREFGDAHPIRYRNPRNPLIVNNEILPILTESDVLEEPISSDDTEWMRLNKHAFQNAKKELGDKWDDEVVAEELTRLLKDKGYDAVDIIQGKDNWLVLLNQDLVRNSITMKHDPKARFPFEFYDHRGNLLYQADNKEQGQQRAEEEWEDKWGSAEMLSRRSKDDKKRRDLAREIQKLFQSIPQAERGKLTNWSKVFKEEDAVKALDAAEDAFANETRGVELESKKSPLDQGMIKKAYKLFGKTNNILAAGYVFPDGSMIEVGETPEGGGSATGYGEGHYEVGIIVDEQQFRKSLQKRDGSEGQLALKFQSLTGAMELAPGAYGKNYKELRVRTAGIPSMEQRQRILQAWKAYDANRLIFDVIENNGKVIFTRSIDAMTAGDIHRLLDEAEVNLLSKESNITELERRKDDSLVGRARSKQAQIITERIDELENQLKESAEKLRIKLLNAENLNEKQKLAAAIRIKFLPHRLGYVDEIGKGLNVTKQRAAQIWADVLTKADALEEETHYKSIRRELNTIGRVAKKGVNRGSELERKKSDKDKPNLSALFDELVPPSPETNNPPKLKGKSYSERAEIDGWLYNMEREIQTLQERGKPVPTSLLKTYHDLKAERDKSASPSVAGGDGSEPPVPPRSRSYYEEYFERNDPDTLEGFSGKDVTKFDHLRSRLSNLDFIGTYERRGGDLGREASEIMRNTQVAIGQSIIDRNVAIKDMKRDLQPIIEAFRYGGKPGLADMIEDHVLGIASGRGHRSQIGRILKKIQYDTKLRFNIKSSVLNMLQPLQTLWPHVSSREFAQLAFQARQPSIRKSILEKVNKEAGAKVEGETEKRRWLPDLFSKASDTNRIMGYLHGMNEAKRLGLSEDRSERLAADWAKKVEFDNSEWDVIPLFEGDIASVLTQFKGFTVKNIESITNDLKKHKEDTLGGYGARAGKRVFSQLVLGGVKSIPGIKTLAGLLVLGTLAKVLGVFFEDDEAETLAEAVYYGAPSLIGEDISNSMMILDPPFGDTVYEQLLNFLGGPTISTTASIIEKGGKQDYMGAVKSITPYYRMGESAIDLIKGGATTLPAPSGHDIELNRFETLMRVLGFTPVKQSRFYEGRGVLNLQSNIAASLGVVKTKNDIPSQLEWKLIDKARKQYLDDPPMSPDSIEHVETEKQIINTLRSGRLADDSITDKAREGARKQLSDAIERDILAPDDESRIAKKAMMSYLQYNVSNMPLENALDIFLDSSATKEERASIAAILADKYMRWQNERMEEAKTHKESVPRKVYERILNKLEQAKKLGIVEMAQEKAKAAIVK
jgi:diguanylate cyclase (GGDEF)-like protein